MTELEEKDDLSLLNPLNKFDINPSLLEADKLFRRMKSSGILTPYKVPAQVPSTEYMEQTK